MAGACGAGEARVSMLARKVSQLARQAARERELLIVRPTALMCIRACCAVCTPCPQVFASLGSEAEAPAGTPE